LFEHRPDRQPNGSTAPSAEKLLGPGIGLRAAGWVQLANLNPKQGDIDTEAKGEHVRRFDGQAGCCDEGAERVDSQVP